ncbi:MAG: PAS domain-containing protein [Patescibacteria group bacterium]|jgi:PAS domain S-box-containing protein
MINKQLTLEKLDQAFLEGKMAWWQMNLPSGEVFFSDAKTDMLGYDSSDFNHYQDFTKLLQPDDYEPAMQAMRDHLTGKKDFYETLYRIKHKNGEYIQFYDFGQMVKKVGEDITIMGFVMKVDKNQNIAKQTANLKKSLLKGSPSMMDLVKKIQQ